MMKRDDRQTDIEDAIKKTTAEAARDQGMQQVAKSNSWWFSKALEVITWMPPDFEGIGEDVRHFVTERIGAPTKPHAWGSLISHAVRRGILFETGKLRKMKDSRSHARRSMVLSRTPPCK